MRKKLLIGVAVAGAMVIALACLVALQPADFRVVRATTIDASAADIFPQVNDFHNWEAWSPWAKLDPDAKKTFAGPPAEPGAVYRWSGNDQIGEGSMTLLEQHSSDLVRIQLDFVRPFKDTCLVEFTLKPTGEQTAVTWSMVGRRDFIGKAICLFFNMDKLVGGDFEKGLSQLKSVTETATRQ